MSIYAMNAYNAIQNVYMSKYLHTLNNSKNENMIKTHLEENVINAYIEKRLKA